MRRIWPQLTGYATALWPLTYGVLGLYWSLAGAGYPFAEVTDDRASGSILEGTTAHIVAPIMAAIGLGGAALACSGEPSLRVHPRGLVLRLATT
jgi:hypothetical protein